MITRRLNLAGPRAQSSTRCYYQPTAAARARAAEAMRSAHHALTLCISVMFSPLSRIRPAERRAARERTCPLVKASSAAGSQAARSSPGARAAAAPRGRGAHPAPCASFCAWTLPQRRPGPGSCTHQTPGAVPGPSRASRAQAERKKSCCARGCTLPQPAGSLRALGLYCAHNDAPLNPRLCVLKQPDLYSLLALQKPEDQVLRSGDKVNVRNFQEQ